MKLTSFVYSSCGGRERNEDTVCTAQDGERSLFVLADGLGGHARGEVASQVAADAMVSAFPDAQPEALLAAVGAANQAVLDAQAESGQKNMKTTLVCVSIDGARAVWAHIGDSRLYHFSGSEIKTKTRDHSVSFKKYLGGEISYLDINHDPDRSSLLRVIGNETCQPEAQQAELKPGDALLLCSDGFWEYVYDQEMVIDWLKSATPQQWVTYMLLRLIARIPAHNDNCSVIAVFAEDEP